MNSLLATNRGKLIFAVSAILLISIILILTLTFITGSLPLSLLIYLALACWAVRHIGTLIMYPGACCFTRTTVELQFSQELSAKMVRCLNALHTVGCCIGEGRRMDYDSRYGLDLTILGHVNSLIEMLSMF